jgi:hypothetical protein
VSVHFSLPKNELTPITALTPITPGQQVAAEVNDHDR